MRPIDRAAETLTGKRAANEALADWGTARPPDRAHRPAAPSEEDIRVRAYHHWEADGRPDGDGVEFWLRAEQELNGLGD